jgi:hypothetical protein
MNQYMDLYAGVSGGNDDIDDILAEEEAIQRELCDPANAGQLDDGKNDYHRETINMSLIITEGGNLASQKILKTYLFCRICCG